MANEHLQQFVEYIKNTGLDGKLTIEQFDDDWEPIGPMVRRDMQIAKLITIWNGKITLVKNETGV